LDETLRKITSFSTHLGFEHLSPAAIHECKRRVLDTLGCALGGFAAQPCTIARAIARKTSSDTPARILGTLEPSSPELAAFANGVMIRYLDMNDATGLGGGHPSDMFGALFAVADSRKVDGRMFISAVAAAYELYLSFFEARQVREKGMDHVVYTATGAAAGVAKMMGLDHRATANAISLALTPNMALGVTRRGQLSMWKGCAGGNAARNAVFAAQLAAEGLAGPEAVFEGDHGVWNAIGKSEWPALNSQGPWFRIMGTPVKMYPCIYPGQSPVTAALAAQPQVHAEEIESIIVRTYYNAWWESASEPEMWAPATRETADHSIPYLVGAALLDGKIDVSSFSDERRNDSALRSLVQKVHVIHDKELDKLTPSNDPCRLEITTMTGRRIASSVDFPKGHVKNPVSDQGIEEKFISMNNGLLAAVQVSRLFDLCWKLEELDDMRELISVVRI
jgi:2-methylcitrate dehydratase